MAHRILVVDDDEGVRDYLRSILEREGYEVADAVDGESAVERFRESSADLIITDIIMPGKEGIELILDIRKDHPNVPIIAISGGGRISPDDYLKTAELIGAQRSIAKPIERAEILGAVRDLLA